MIIDSTVSVIERKIVKHRRLENLLSRKGFSTTSEVKKRLVANRESAIRDFLIKEGKDTDDPLNYIVFWKCGKVDSVHLLSEPSDEELAKARAEKKQKKEEHMDALYEKFTKFLSFAGKFTHS
jgi:hypothetical protein